MQYQKPILGLVAIQAVILIFLAFKVTGLEVKMAETTAHTAPEPSKVNSPDMTMAYSPSEYSGLSAQDVREILQDELSLIQQQIENISRAAEINQELSTAVHDPRETARLESLAISQINSLGSGADILATDIAKLELTIAKLPSAERKKALGELNKAINAGRIKVRF